MTAEEVVERPVYAPAVGVPTPPRPTVEPALDAPSPVRLRRPDRVDGGRMWQFVARHGGLEQNTAYAYVVLAGDFADTSVVAEGPDGDLAGFVLGYRPPDRPDALFVWQIGTSPAHRGQGIAGRMLLHLVQRPDEPDNAGIHYLEATVTPSNTASRRLFRSVARRLGADCAVSGHLTGAMFPAGDHEPEDLFRIGPF